MRNSNPLFSVIAPMKKSWEMTQKPALGAIGAKKWGVPHKPRLVGWLYVQG